MKKAKRTFTENNTDVLLSEGVSAYQAGNIEDADTAFRQVLKLDANHADANHLLGLIARQVGNNKVAIDLISKAILADSDNAFYHNNLGNALKDLDRINEAVASYRKAIAILPNLATAHSNLGSALRVLGQLKDGKASLQMAIRLEPDMASAHVNLGNIMKDMGRNEDAEASYRSGLNLDPNNSDALTNIGSLLEEQNHDAESIDYYRKAIAIDPDSEIAHKNMANVLYKTGSLSEAENALRCILKKTPDNALAHKNIGIINLLKGNFKIGWEEYSWRRFEKNTELTKRIYSQPLWNGEDLNGKTIFVYTEQGFGDTIQFVRYLDLLREQGGRVVLDAQLSLVPLLEEMESINVLLKENDLIPPFDFHVPLMELPRLFSTNAENIPAPNAYLMANEELVEAWKERLGPKKGYRVGIVWAGSPTHQDDYNRSMMPELFIPLTKVPGVSVFSFLVGRKDNTSQIFDDNISDLSKSLTNFAETAAAITNMDLVISVDTAVVHLAGALGKPVWTLLQFNPDWRWMLDRNDSPWYSSMKLFRQEKRQDWQSVIERVTSDLRILVLLSEGVSAYQAGNIEDADTAFRQVLKLDANHADANHLLGLIARQVGNNKVAIDLISKAILADSDNAFYHNNLGNALKDLDRINEAVASYRKAIAILPNLATAHSNLGSALRVLGQLKDGKASLQMAIRLEPDMASAHVNLGNIMKDMGRNEDAEASYRSGLNLDPNNSDALTNIGSLLEEQNHDAESIDYYRKAIAIDPDSEIAHKNMANALYKTGSLSEAENVYRHALELNPKYKDTEFGLSLTLLSLGQLKEGWLRYESRFNLLNVVSDTFSISNSFNRAITDFAQPEWNGSALVEKSIILWGDQGLGDEVRFASIIPDLQRTGAKITIECDKRLTDIFARSFPEATILAYEHGGAANNPKEFDYQCPLTGLARFFRNDYESFANDGNGHLKADPALTTFWKKRLKDIGPQPKIGISWNSPVKVTGRVNHYASIEELSPILNTSGIDFVNLQSHESNEDLAKARKQFGVEIHTWNDLDYKNDLNGIAALTSNLDLVISFPTFSAELAGSLGVPTLCFVSHKNSFEELGSNDNIWYHNTHHISKNINDPWQPVFEKIAEIVRLKFDL